MIDDINQVNEQGQTALIRAALDPNGEEAGLALLQAGADPKKVDEDGDAALHFACKNGHKALVTALLERGVDIEQTNCEGETPLIFAASSPNGDEVALILLKAGADPHKVDQAGDSALHRAAYAGHKALVTTLLEQGVDIDQNGLWGRTPLIGAARSPDGEEVALMLLEAGADPKNLDQDGNTALHAACCRGHKALITALLEQGMDIEQTNSEGETPLIVAAHSSDGEEAALMLLESGADPKKIDHFGNSALHRACRSGGKAIVIALLEQGLDINQDNNEGRTPLMLAAQSKSGEKKALALLKAGADPTKTDNQGRSAAYFAEKEGHTELLLALGRKGQQSTSND